MTRLSIVIPGADSRSSFEETLASVLANRPDDTQIISVFPGHYDDPYDLAGEMEIVESNEGADVIQLANEGIARGSGEFIHLILPGVSVHEGWTATPLDRLSEDRTLASVSPLIVDAVKPRHIVAAGVAYKSSGRRNVCAAGRKLRRNVEPRFEIHGPTLLAGFYRKSALSFLSGFQSLFGPELADVDLALRLRAAGYKYAFEPTCLLTSSRAAPAANYGFEYGRRVERLFWRHAEQPPGIRTLSLHVFEIVFSSLRRLPRTSSLTELAGRLTEWRHDFRQRKQLPNSMPAEPIAIPLDPSQSTEPKYHRQAG